MSLLDTASLIVTPNGYKEGKLYSVIPSDGSGDLSVTRATTATRVNSAGLVELVPYNLVQYSEQFDNAAWTKNSVSVTANSTTAPNGTTTADTITETSTLGFFYQTASASGVITFSVYLKRTNNDWANVTIATTGSPSGEFRVWFNLATGVVGTTANVGAGVVTDSDIENVGNGWYRVSVTGYVTGALGYTTYIFNTNADNSFTTSVGQSRYQWGAQLVEGSTAKDYQKTETRLNIPRLDYSNGTCPSLLVEPQRTNLLAYSEQFDNAGYWSIYQSSITGDTTTAPNGTQTADTLTALANTGGDAYRLINFSGTHTASCYIKAGTSNKARIGFSSGEVVFYDLSTGVVTTSGVVTGSMVDAGNGWWRCIATVNSTTIYTAFSNDGTNGQTVYLWGAQLEAGSYATSYIPTTSASVTRNADVISKTGISSLIGQTQGAVFIDLNIDSSFAQNDMRFINVGDGTAANWYFIGTNAANQIRFYYRTSNTAYVSFTTTLTDGHHKLAYAYANGDYVAYVDGTLVHSDNTIVVGSASQLNLGNDFGNFSPSKQFINAAALWKTRLTNTQLAQLTTI
jgi:hypothetical protein